MEAFSDGVFAIAITLLVLEIGVPGGSEDDLLGALADQWPSYVAYLVSFSTVGAVWFMHTTSPSTSAAPTPSSSGPTSCCCSSSPSFRFRRSCSRVRRESDAARVASTVYGLNLLATAALIGVLWGYAVRAGSCGRTPRTRTCAHSPNG